MDGIPASSLIPPAFNADRPEWIWEPKFLKPGENRKIYMTSEIFSGWLYYTAEREVRLSQSYPNDYEADIGYAYKNGPGKTDAEGNAAEKKAKPKSTWLFRGWLCEDGKMVAVVIDNFFIQSQITEKFNSPDFMLLANSCTNFYLDIIRSSNEKALPALQFSTEAHLRPCGSKAALQAAQDPFFSDRYWMGLNPLDASAEPPKNAGKPSLPPTSRDGNGAEEEAVVPKEEKLDW